MLLVWMNNLGMGGSPAGTFVVVPNRNTHSRDPYRLMMTRPVKSTTGTGSVKGE